jgi:hypothetical protein
MEGSFFAISVALAGRGRRHAVPTGIGVPEVVPVPLSERGQEGLGEQVVGDLAASAPGTPYGCAR